MNAFDFRIRISSNVISQEVLLGETLLLDTASLAYFGLDDLGTAFWREMNDCDNAAEVFERVSASSDVAVDILERKFNGIIKGLEMTGIIKIIRQPNENKDN